MFVLEFERNTGKNLWSFKTCGVVAITRVFKFRQLIASSVNVKKIPKLFKLLLLLVEGGSIMQIVEVCQKHFSSSVSAQRSLPVAKDLYSAWPAVTTSAS